MFGSFITKYSAWSNYRKAYKELNKLSDRELNDIGVSRYDIGRVLRSSKRV